MAREKVFLWPSNPSDESSKIKSLEKDVWGLVSGAEILSDKPNEIRCDFMIVNEVRIPQGEEKYHISHVRL